MFIKHNRRWYLQGITSTSLIDNGSCDLASDAVFTNVFKFSKWIAGIISTNLQLPQQSTSETRKKEIFCYFRDLNFKIDQLDLNLCTFLVYSFGELEGDDLKAFNRGPMSEIDVEESLKTFTALKESYPHLVTLLNIDSGTFGNQPFSSLAADGNRRKRFADNSVAFLKKRGFDGLDIYWRFPTEYGGRPEDRENYVELLRDLKSVYESENFYLTASLTATNVHEMYNIKGIAQHVNFINLMTFGYTGHWNLTIDFSSPLSGEGSRNIKSVVDKFLKHGVSAEKLLLGLSCQGTTFVTGLTGKIGDHTVSFQQGAHFYSPHDYVGLNQICDWRKTKKWEERFDPIAAQVIGSFRDKITYAMTFDSPRSVANKVRYAMEKNLGGVSMVALEKDDFSGKCEVDETTFDDFARASSVARKEKDFPLLRTVNETIEVTKYFWYY